MNKYEIEFKDKLKEHLENYYITLLGLKDFERRYNYRLNEEKYEELRLVALLKKINYFNKKENIKMLVVGSGWGGMIYAAKKLGIDIVGLDIDEIEIEISKLRFLKDEIEPCEIVCSAAENMPFENNTFDLIYCYSVIEHVQDVNKVMSEISRVLKKDAFLYLQVPNYNIPWEGHYKMIIPTFFGKKVTKQFVSLRGRDSKFIDTLNFIRKGSFLKLLQQNNIPQIEEWNVLDFIDQTTIAQNINKTNKKETLSYKLKNRLDEYIGGKMLKILKIFGVTHVFSISKKI